MSWHFGSCGGSQGQGWDGKRHPWTLVGARPTSLAPALRQGRTDDDCVAGVTPALDAALEDRARATKYADMQAQSQPGGIAREIGFAPWTQRAGRMSLVRPSQVYRRTGNLSATVHSHGPASSCLILGGSPPRNSKHQSKHRPACPFSTVSVWPRAHLPKADHTFLLQSGSSSAGDKKVAGAKVSYRDLGPLKLRPLLTPTSE